MKRRRTFPFTLGITVVMLTMLAACGGTTAEPDASEPGSAPASDGAPDAAPSDAAPAQPETGEAGSFTVDDTSFAVTNLNRCIPFSESADDLDLQARAPGAQLNLYLDGGSTDVSVQGSAVQELAGSMAFGLEGDDPESSISGDRWTGSATVVDAMGSGTSVDLTWDVQIPSEIRDCSL